MSISRHSNLYKGSQCCFLKCAIQLYKCSTWPPIRCERHIGARWEMRKEIWDSQNNTCFSNTDNTHENSLLCHDGSYFISTVEMRWNTENLVGHMAPFPMILKSPLWSTLLGIVSKRSVRQDHKPRGYTRLSQTTAIRHSWFRYKYSKIETGNIERSPFVVRQSALSHIPFLFLVIHEFSVTT